MPMRHRPFGIPETSLRQELRRRRADNGKALAPRRTELTRLRQSAAELTRYLELLAAETALLEGEQRTLMRELGEVASSSRQPPGPPPTPEADELMQTLRHYRALQSELTASVLTLIAPFLDRKEEAAWRSGPRPTGSESGEH